jgi:hypothetical protein
MAPPDKRPTQPQDPATDQMRMILPMEVLGIIQRSLAELNAYLGMPANQVDPAIILARLERMGHWAMTLPRLPQPPDEQASVTAAKPRSN